MTDHVSPLDMYLRALSGKKAFNPVALDVKNLTSVADYFIICSARSGRQVKAVADHVRRRLKEQGVTSLSAEGVSDGHWALLDYGDVVIHIFYEETRKFYDLEGLWGDAGRIDISTYFNSDVERGSADESDMEDDDD